MDEDAHQQVAVKMALGEAGGAGRELNTQARLADGNGNLLVLMAL